MILPWQDQSKAYLKLPKGLFVLSGALKLSVRLRFEKDALVAHVLKLGFQQGSAGHATGVAVLEIVRVKEVKERGKRLELGETARVDGLGHPLPDLKDLG